MRSIMKRTGAGAILAALLAVAPLAAQDAKSADGKAKGDNAATMPQMMKTCHEHQATNIEMMNETMTMMQKAEKSNDKAEMRKALNQARERMQSMRQHTETCMERMNDMPGMQGHMMDHDGMMKGGGMMDGGQKKGGDSHKGHGH